MECIYLQTFVMVLLARHCQYSLHGVVLFGKRTFPRVTENDSMKALSLGYVFRLKSNVTLENVQP